MKTKFGNFVLSEEGETSPQASTTQGGRAVQVDELPGAENPLFNERGNKWRRWNFTTEREHESYGEAAFFCAIHDDELPIMADLTIEGRKKGAGKLRRISRDVLLETVQSSHRGVRSFHTYSFLVGAWE